jgi:The GLUG motif
LFAQTSTPTSAGDGSSGNPYQIATLDNLYWLTQNSTDWGDYFIQTADIDADSTSTWDFDNGFSPIGNSTNKFSGSYDGDGHTVSNLKIQRFTTSDLGFFGYTASGSVIKNLVIENADIQGKNYIGVLVGVDSSTISNCYSTGVLGNGSYIGGLVGSTIDNSGLTPPPPPPGKALLKVTTQNSTISNCYSNVSISNGTSQSSCGGLVGYNTLTISNCYSTGSVSGSGTGGLVGTNTGTISNCYSTGSVGSASGNPGVW